MSERKGSMHLTATNSWNKGLIVEMEIGNDQLPGIKGKGYVTYRGN